MFVTSGWHVASALFGMCFQEFTRNGWEEEHDKKTGFRCLTMFDADMGVPLKVATAKAEGIPRASIATATTS